MKELAEEMTTVEQKTTAEPEAPMEEPSAEESMMGPAEYITMAWPGGWRSWWTVKGHGGAGG